MTEQRPPEIGSGLAYARERSGFTQDEVALLVGQPRPVVSNWESGARRPNSQQLGKLAAIYRTSVEELLESGGERIRPDFERLLFRDAGERLDTRGKFEIQRFLAFLDSYADFLELSGESPGLTEPPFSLREGFSAKEDVRRKAEQARDWFQLGSGPVGDLLGLSDLHGITVYLAPLGADLKTSVSGAFLPHDRVGFSILLNAETTPGRRQFTLAHELGHALFHGDHAYVDYYGRREAAERFANAFAAEFLVPTKSLRAAVEAIGVAKVRDAELVVHLQRLFRVSYAMILVRLRAANLVSEPDLVDLRAVHPLPLAGRLGYAIEPDEWAQDPDRWGLARFPPRFLRLLRRALEAQEITVSGAASMTGLAQEDFEAFLAQRAPSPEDSHADEDFEYYQSASS